jgi:alpha,alpha-trehalase
MQLYIEQLSPLYEDVQLSGIFSDSKFFVDSTPNCDTSFILSAYATEKKIPNFSLLEFVKKYFHFPAEHPSNYESANKPIDQHIQDLWDELTRQPTTATGTLIQLPYPYIVPGGRFREIYYWDSYFTMLGLQQSGRVDLIEQMVKNFAALIDQFGFIPNGNRTYYLGRSQPPFFALMVAVLMDSQGAEILNSYLPQLEKEYAFWMEGADKLNAENTSHRRVVRLFNGTVLNRYWDDKDGPRPEAYIEDVHVASLSTQHESSMYKHIRAAAESGWDFSSRWFAEPDKMETIETTDIIPVDLNCLLYYLEVSISMGHFNSGDITRGKIMQQKAEKRKQAIHYFFWKEEDGFFFDYNWQQRKCTNAKTLAGVFPLFFHICTVDEATEVAKFIELHFLKPGGVVTTTETTMQQWDAPNGWAPLQWITYKAMEQHGFEAIAEKIKLSWITLNKKVYAETGKMMEKYNVVDITTTAGGGEYPNQDGFGWTNGIFLALTTVK